MFTKPLVLSKHAKARFEERARGNKKRYSWKNDLNSFNVQRMVKKQRDGKEFLHVWTKGNKHYILQEQKNCFVVVTMIQKNKFKKIA